MNINHRVIPPHRVPPHTTQPRKPHNQQKEDKGKVSKIGEFVNVLKSLLPKKDEVKNGNVK